ncbi:MAG: ELM1/GtrOC1 family putative glycosyltransferase [Gammaproteobacteria bacterium]|nr:ELM1/GtrOC1 family putative glycosyltransferase [Gammaproteobacteria bacterium]
MTDIVLWVFSDGRKGHEKQSIGLLQAIKSLIENSVEVHRIAVGTPVKRLSKLPKPCLVLGAGNATHLPMLMTKVLFKVPCVVLMKPSLPTIFFDLVLVPHHDVCSNFGNVHMTRGALCPIPDVCPNPKYGVILLGGTSRHFHWDSESVLDTVSNICNASPHKHWTICDSPRSPANLLSGLDNLSNVTTRQWQTTSESFITDLLNSSSETWVTCDSVSMLYEALNTGSPVGVIELSSKRKTNKLARGIQDLAKNNQVQLSSAGYSIGTELSVPPPGQESRRCAELCVNLLKLRKCNKIVSL